MNQDNSTPRAPFIVGMGRSGTTLLRLMIDKHPLLSIPPETHFIFDVINKARVMPMDVSVFFDVLVSSRLWRDFDLDADNFHKRLIALPTFSISDGLRCFYTLCAEQQNKKSWGDKTPTYLYIMREIHDFLPESFFIHLIRDGRDSALSYRGLWFGPGDNLSMHAKIWSDRIIQSRIQAGSLIGSYLEVRYEHLVTAPEKILKGICTAIDYEFDETMLAYFLSAPDRIRQLKTRLSADGTHFIEAERLHRIHKMTARSPDATRTGRWRTEMTEGEQMIYEREAGHVLNELGYETNYPELWQI
jgi:hypothetical protein